MQAIEAIIENDSQSEQALNGYFFSVCFVLRVCVICMKKSGKHYWSEFFFFFFLSRKFGSNRRTEHRTENKSIPCIEVEREALSYTPLWAHSFRKFKRSGVPGIGLPRAVFMSKPMLNMAMPELLSTHGKCTLNSVIHIVCTSNSVIENDCITNLLHPVALSL